jgi:serine/threonine-protein kinase HipA
MKRGRAEAILEEVRRVVSCWPEYAKEARVLAEWREKIARTLRLERY